MTEISRRTLLIALALGPLAAAGCGNHIYRGPEHALTIAAGEEGGLYLPFAKRLANEICIEEPRLHAEAISTNGSLDNLERLDAGKVDLALVLADAAQDATSTGGPLAAPVQLHAIGRVYENYLQLVVLADSQIETLPDLAGRTVSLGADNSGAKLTGGRLLTAAGLASSAAPAAVIVEHLELSKAVDALEEGRIQALLWSGGVPTPLLAELSAHHDIRLLPVDDNTLKALRSVTHLASS